jgi:hypothetical protein
MRTNRLFFCLLINLSLLSTAALAQTTANFDETWKEFLENDKISNMSELVRPDKVYDPPKYARYLLMNINSSFCQSNVAGAESMMAELKGINADVLKSIPGFMGKMEDLETKIKAWHSMDAIWNRFLLTRQVSPDELEAITAAKTICEKSTLAKYSFMTAYNHLCRGDVSKSQDIFENRTLKLIEKTSLRVEDVQGLAPEAAKMKSLFRNLPTLETAWKTYVETGVSPGFKMDLPLFPCYPIPNMKVLVLNGVVDLCNAGPENLEKIKTLQAESGVAPDRVLEEKVKKLEAAIAQNERNLSALNEAWEAFIPNNKTPAYGSYGYEYCTKEPLIRAYIMDGFSYVCDMAEESLRKIDALQKQEMTPLEKITMTKINELAALHEKYRSNGAKIEKVWRKFVAQGGALPSDYQPTDLYCDNIHQVKDWTIQGLSGGCEEGYSYLDQIETFQQTFEFDFFEELECQVQKLRIKVWDCRYQILQDLARVEASPGSYEERLKELLEEYGMGMRPVACPVKK